VAFVVVAFLHVPFVVALLLAVILLVHEAGHWIAMRLSGQRDVRIFFIPFFGAITTARSVPTTAGARAAIALAGPVPGIVAGVLLARFYPQPGLARAVAVVLLYVNVMNLLPIGFLDGGKVVSTLFLSRFPRVEGAFAVASAIPMGLMFTGKGGSGAGIVGGLVVGTLFAALRRFRVAQEARTMGAVLGDHRDPLSLPDEVLRALHEGAVRIAAKDKRIKGAPQLAAVMRELFEELAAPRPTQAEQVGYGFAWAAALAIGWISLAEAGVRLLS
jgi:Zn-dependent protease